MSRRGSDAPVNSNWQQDSDATNCNACNAKFTIRKRRHHCRRCGYVFCAACSSKKTTLPSLGYYDHVRVCDQCFKRRMRGVSRTPELEDSGGDENSASKATQRSANLESHSSALKYQLPSKESESPLACSSSERPPRSSNRPPAPTVIDPLQTAASEARRRKIMLISVDEYLETKPWFFPIMTREMAEQMLLSCGTGYALIRKSNSEKGLYVVSGNYPEGSFGGLQHVLVTPRPSGEQVQFLFTDRTHREQCFASLEEVVNRGLGLRLINDYEQQREELKKSAKSKPVPTPPNSNSELIDVDDEAKLQAIRERWQERQERSEKRTRSLLQASVDDAEHMIEQKRKNSELRSGELLCARQDIQKPDHSIHYEKFSEEDLEAMRIRAEMEEGGDPRHIIYEELPTNDAASGANVDDVDMELDEEQNPPPIPLELSTPPPAAEAKLSAAGESLIPPPVPVDVSPPVIPQEQQPLSPPTSTPTVPGDLSPPSIPALNDSSPSASPPRVPAEVSAPAIPKEFDGAPAVTESEPSAHSGSNYPAEKSIARELGDTLRKSGNGYLRSAVERSRRRSGIDLMPPVDIQEIISRIMAEDATVMSGLDSDTPEKVALGFRMILPLFARELQGSSDSFSKLSSVLRFMLLEGEKWARERHSSKCVGWFLWGCRSKAGRFSSDDRSFDILLGAMAPRNFDSLRSLPH